jgi:metal-responsive CopG/Arc/MetJ family transcriptional regulator
MKEKTSITLSKELLARVDRLARSKQSRSAFIERVLRKYFKDRRQASIHARDLKLLNQAADRLNREADDVLEYQTSTE